MQQPGSGQRQRGDVVAERPHEVLLDRPQRRPEEGDGVRRGPQIAGDERQVGGLDGETSVPVPIARPRSGLTSARPDVYDRRRRTGGKHP